MDVQAVLHANEARLAALYGGEAPLARYEKLANTFREQFLREPECFVSAPGRTEVVGNHTDHQGGRVLTGAVTMDTLAAAAPRGDNLVKLFSEGYGTPFVVDLNETEPKEEEKETTLALIRGVASRLKALGHTIGGFDASVTSTVFKGSGLSSSAAFEVMLTAVFDALYLGGVVDPETNARVSQYAENVFFGKPSGLLDQTASATGGLVTIDFGHGGMNVEQLQYNFAARGYTVCVVSAGGDHGNLTDQYAAIPGEMRQVARAMGRETLGDVTPAQVWNALPALKGKVPDRALLRAFHYVDENQRVLDAVDALRRDDLPAFFRAVVASGESSWKLLQNLFVPGSDNQEMPLALGMSRRMLEGRGAWRIHGGGFAGTILAFVPNDLLDEYRRNMDAVFGEDATCALSIRPEGAVCLK